MIVCVSRCVNIWKKIPFSTSVKSWKNIDIDIGGSRARDLAIRITDICKSDWDDIYGL